MDVLPIIFVIAALCGPDFRRAVSLTKPAGMLRKGSLSG